MIKTFKKFTLALFISSAIACSGVAQSSNQWENRLATQKDRGGKRGPERPVERKRNDDRNDDRGDRGGSKRGDDNGKKGKRPDGF
jgi:hypothetical protein